MVARLAKFFSNRFKFKTFEFQIRHDALRYHTTLRVTLNCAGGGDGIVITFSLMVLR
jgi:hypothetical protein